MKRIVELKTLENSNAVEQEKIIVSHYLKELFELYNINTIKGIGDIFIIEKESELSDFRALGLYEPISSDNIEFLDKIFISRNRQEENYLLACFNIYTDYSIYLLLDITLLSPEQLKIFNQARYITNQYLDLED